MSRLRSFATAAIIGGLGVIGAGFGPFCESAPGGLPARGDESGDEVRVQASDAGPPDRGRLEVSVPSLWRRVSSRNDPRSEEVGVRPPSDDLSTAELEARARARELDESYPYHDRSRTVDGELECPEVELVEYDGRVVPYNRPVEINPHFRARLIRFERLVREVAVDVYGRPPARIVHRGAHDCKTVGRNGERLSEHAFGHAIDIIGFDFDPIGGDGDASAPRTGGFEVRLAEHWDGDEGFAATHRQFLRRLAEVLERRGPFSTMLGPSYPNHDEIFHFDFGPEFFFRL